MPHKAPSTSLIYAFDLSPDMILSYLSPSVKDLLGFEPEELIGTSCVQLFRLDEVEKIQHMHMEAIANDKAAVILYGHLRHKNPEIGYVLASVSRTVAEDVVIGSATLALHGAGAMQSAATASEVIILAPEALEFQFYKWNDRDPMYEPESQPSQPAPPLSVPRASTSSSVMTLLNPLEESTPQLPAIKPSSLFRQVRALPSVLRRPSPRTAIILDRFSRTLPIIYVSNTRLLPPTAEGRSFFDFVRARDERLVRAWIDAVKGWDAGAGGLGAGGGFGYGRFGFVLAGRHSRRKTSGSRQRFEPEEHVGADITNQPEGSTRGVGRAQKTNMARVTRERRTASVGGQHRMGSDPDVVMVDGIFSAHSDGLLVILRRAKDA